MVVEGDARRNHVHQREAAMGDGCLQDGNQLFLVARETARDECSADAQAQHHRINGGHAIGFTLFTLRADIGGCRKLTLGQSVHAVVLDDVNHPQVAPDGMAHVTQADGERIAIARNADIGQLAIRGVGAGGDGWHAPMGRVESMRAVDEIGGRLGRTADAAELGDHVRLGGKFPKSAHNGSGD